MNQIKVLNVVLVFSERKKKRNLKNSWYSKQNLVKCAILEYTAVIAVCTYK